MSSAIRRQSTDGASSASPADGYAYLTDWRLALAADLLRQPDATIGAVARQVGYSSSVERGVQTRTGKKPQRTPSRRDDIRRVNVQLLSVTFSAIGCLSRPRYQDVLLEAPGEGVLLALVESA